MPNIQKTRAIVLHTMPYMESSLLCSVFSERFGKLKLIAKGARRPKSKFCGALEPFSHTEMIFYRKEHKEIYTLSDAVVINDFKLLRDSPLKFTAGELLCEFVDKTQPIEEPVLELYNLLLYSLHQLIMLPAILVRPWALSVLFRFLKFTGIEPHLKDCVRCHKKIQVDDVYFSIASGGLVCDSHLDPSVIRLKKDHIRYLKDPKLEEFDQKGFIILRDLFESYISYHLHGIFLNALKFL
jgi:DNA repair protein RecO (recombination protein O)